LIEKLRVNTRYDMWGAYITQVEAIFLLLVLAGLAGMLVTFRTWRFWTRGVISAGVHCGLAACAPHLAD
jgi:hypothetical protein